MYMKILITTVALLLGFATSFTHPKKYGSRTSLHMSVFDKMDGAVDFRGKKFEFDPLNLAESYEPFQLWFREAEIRHGRTAMVAVLGFIATDFIRLPGEMYSFEAIPKTIDAHDALLKVGPMYQLLLWIGLWDLIITAPAVQAMGQGEREPGGKPALRNHDFYSYWIQCQTLTYKSTCTKN